MKKSASAAKLWIIIAAGGLAACSGGNNNSNSLLSPTPVPLPSPSVTPTPIATPGPTVTPTPAVTATPSPTVTPSATPTPTNGPTVTPTPAFFNQTGSSEPLYQYQWALSKAASFFASLTGINFSASDGLDLNVESVHSGQFAQSEGRQIKGAGVRVLVLDDGVDVRNEDLLPNVDATMLRNFEFLADDTTNSEFGVLREGDAGPLRAADDPTPITTKGGETVNVEASHGTNVAGIILAAQNGKGVMGIAPLASLGGASFLQTENANTAEAYGGGNWARNADLINASFGSNPDVPPSFDLANENVELRAIVPAATNENPQVLLNQGLRQGKGGLFVKASGNEFDGIGTRLCQVDGGVEPIRPMALRVSCETPANDLEALEPMTILVASLNAAGVRASYSNAGGVNFVTGTGGEFGSAGSHGQNPGADGSDGPTMFSTDLRGRDRGYARDTPEGTADFLITTTATAMADNPNGDYSFMNGTSAATPSVTGVIALMMSANPELGWRDVREILAATSRRVDDNYASRVGADRAFSLVNRMFTTEAGSLPADGDSSALLERGWTTTGGQAIDSSSSAGGTAALGQRALQWSSWYGFGLVDAKAAVEMAVAYRSYLRTTLTPADLSTFAAIGHGSDGQGTSLNTLTYGRTTEVGRFSVTGDHQIDQVQLRLSGDICIGSVGFAVVKDGVPGRLTYLSTPMNSYYSNTNAENTGGATAVLNYALGSYGFFGLPAAGTYRVLAVSTRPTTGATDSSRCGDVGQGDNFTQNLTQPLRVEYRILPRVLDLKPAAAATSARLTDFDGHRAGSSSK